MKFKLNIEIDLGNAAFADNPYETYDILKKYLEDASLPMEFNDQSIWFEDTPLKDSNGNRVGTANAEVTS